MAITRKTPKVDIRSMRVEAHAHSKETDSSSTPMPTKHELAHHNPLQEIRAIFLYVIPLLILLAIASYLDTTRGWVVTFAAWLMH